MTEAITATRYGNVGTSQNYKMLVQKFEEVENEQGIFGKAWNGLKEITDAGVSGEKCEKMLERYKNGTISFDEALDYINNFESKQKSATELVKNITTGVGAIAATAATVGTGGAMGAVLAAGALSGGAIKTGLGVADRATNGIEDDALDAKEVAKDCISGAVTGATSAVSSGVSKGIRQGKFGLSVLNGTKCGLACGAVSGATSYMTDVALDEDKTFNFGDLTKTTATSALVSGVVGGSVGAGMYGTAAATNSIGENFATMVAQDATTSSIRKVGNRTLRDIASAVA